MARQVIPQAFGPWTGPGALGAALNPESLGRRWHYLSKLNQYVVLIMAAEIGVAAALFYKSADLGPERSFSYPFLDAIEDLKANFIEVENLSKSYIFIQSSLVNYLKPFLAERLSFFDNLLEKKGAIWMGCK